MTNPFEGITNPAILLAMVQDGVKCERRDGKGVVGHWYAMDDYGSANCPTCNGSGHTPLPNADLDALAACWCEGIFVRNRIWEYPKNYTYYVPNPAQYTVRGNWVSLPAYTTSPDAAMRLMLEYKIEVIDWFNSGGGRLAIYPGGTIDFTENELFCHAITTAALVAALTEAMTE